MEASPLVYEDGEWFCLSKQPNLPVAIDDTVDASMRIASGNPSAFVAARERNELRAVEPCDLL